jgi:hypothetical protein
LEECLYDAVEPRLRPAAEVVGSLLDTVADALRTHGEWDEVAGLLAAALARGSSASRQRMLAHARGDLTEVTRTVVDDLACAATPRSATGDQPRHGPSQRLDEARVQHRVVEQQADVGDPELQGRVAGRRAHVPSRGSWRRNGELAVRANSTGSRGRQWPDTAARRPGSAMPTCTWSRPLEPGTTGGVVPRHREQPA